MKSLNALVALFVVILLAIAFRNVGAIGQPGPVDLYVTTADFPLAALFLIGLVVVTVLHFATVGRIRMQAAIESRELHRELDRARRAAEKAEDSRVAELRSYLEREIPEIEVKLDLALERLAVRVPATLPEHSRP